MLRQIIQANFVSLVGLLFIMFFITANPLFPKKQNRRFQLAILCNLLLLIVTSLDYAFAGSGNEFYLARRFTSFLNFSCGPVIPLLLWSIFSEQKLKFAAYIPLMMSAVICFLSMFYPLVFFIGENNSYGRGPLFFISILTSIFYLIMIIRQPVKKIYSKHAERLFLMFIILFMIVSVAAEVIVACQFINYNTSAVSLILYYLLLTIQTNIVDPLTGAYNRFMYEHEVQRLEETSDFIITMLDINNFKKINDQYGHSNGDKCLTLLVDTFVSKLVNAKIYRIGGDEFVIISKKCTMDAVKTMIDGIKMLLNEQQLDFAYGSCEYKKGEAIADTLDKADQLMYADKKNSKDFYFHDPII